MILENGNHAIVNRVPKKCGITLEIMEKRQMKEKRVENELLMAILASVQNHEWCNRCQGKRKSFIYKLKFVVWYFFLMILAPHMKINSSKMICAMTPVNKKRLMAYMDNGPLFCFARLNGCPSQMKVNNSVLSPYSMMQRVLICLEAMFFYNRFRKDLRGYFHFTLEYYSIAKYVDEHGIETIICPCMYDRYCTFLSYYANARSIKIIGVQDGAAIDIHIPRKVYCTEMNCFDEFEGTIIKKFIANEDCIFRFTGFTSTLSWQNYKNNKYTIAVASQDWFTNQTLDLLEILLDKVRNKNINVVVFPHYREYADQYKDIRTKYPYLIVETGDRYANIDLLITFYSTIVYDFWSVNPSLHVKCLRIPGYEPGYYGRKNVLVYDDAKVLVESISTEIGKI